MGQSEVRRRVGTAASACVTFGAVAHLANCLDGTSGLLAEGAAGLLLLAGGAAALAAGFAGLLGRAARRPALGLAGLGLGAALALATQVYPALSRGLAERFGPPEDIPDTLLALGPGGRDVRLSGTLTAGAGARLAALLAANPRVERIHLTSDGGLVEEGLALGEAIAARGLATYVPDYCVSACTLAFLRGRERLLMAEARLGFHSPYETGIFGEILAIDSAPERRAYLRTGLSPDFVEAALRVAPKEVWTPTPERLRAAGAVTGIVGADRLPDSTLDDDPTLAGARAAVLSAVGLMRPLAEGAPARLDAVAARYLDAYRQGRSEAHGQDVIRLHAARQIAEVLAGAPDAVLLDLGRFLLRAARASDPDEAEECAALVREADLVSAAEILGRREPRAAESARALLGRALEGRDGAGAIRPRRRPLASPARLLGCGDLQDALARDLAQPEAAAHLRALLFPGARPPGAQDARGAREATARPRE
ncbi:conserved hypothetical protein [Methylobacterium sp. 4-46]|uniref:hypothetical protein n=1 Tax=Methylobacterium sp. (strain 4-46) TaxID=426117 RepID=UPI000165CBC7|nr:hypothetical protein [Methylobacterium sp. 4-46]ACA19002.1 conserved hypothetical protein [Methylobacterium sp. 4-46]